MTKTQNSIHNEWDEDIDFALSKLEMLKTKLNRIKNQATMLGLHD
jgi:hypothetical protein